MRQALLRPLLALTLALAPAVGAAAQVTYSADVPVTGSSRLEYLKDPGGSLGLQAVTAAGARFVPVPGRIGNFGLGSAAYWLRLRLQATGRAATTVYLSISQPTLDSVQLFVLEHGVLRETARAGDRIPLRQRSYPADHPLLPIALAPGHSYRLYLRIAGDMGAKFVPMRFESAADVARHTGTSLLLNGLLIGIIGSVLLYNLFVYLGLRDPIYLFYLGTLVVGYVCVSILDGFGLWQLFPRALWLQNQGLPLFAGATFTLNALFARRLLDTVAVPWLDSLLLALAAAGVLLFASPLLLPETLLYRFLVPMALFAPLINALTGAVALHRRHPQALLFCASRVVGWSGMIGYVLTIGGVLEAGSLMRTSFSAGFAIGALLLSLALTDRIRALRARVDSAEHAARRALSIRHEELERKVEVRTRELEQARRHAEYLATTDALTQLANRRGLMPRLELAIDRARQHGAPLSMVTFDIDHFKQINDEFGHAEGDRLLQQIATLTRSVVRAGDLLGRIGGEEFMIVLESPRETAAELAERLRAQIEVTARAGSSHRHVTASFGVSALSPRLDSADALQRAADAALYRAKNRGRNCVEIFDETSNATTRTRAIMRAG